MSLPASDWVRRWAHLIPPGGRVLDVACGSGRHMAYLATHGFHPLGIDRNAEALSRASAYGQTLLADLENAAWPLLMPDGRPQTFDAVLVTNYLWRPLLPTLLQSLQPGGVLLYETFAAGNETVGRPSRPDFLLQPGELLAMCRGLRVVAFEDGFAPDPPRFIQRIAAAAPAPADGPAHQPAQYPLWLE